MLKGLARHLHNLSNVKCNFPKIQKLEVGSHQGKLKKIVLINPGKIHEVEEITPEDLRQFKTKHKVTVGKSDNKVTYVDFNHPQREKIEGKSKVLVDYDSELELHPELSGALSTLFSSSYEFSLKTTEPPKQQPQIFYSKETDSILQAIVLAECRTYAREVANQRGNVATTEWMEEECRSVATDYGLNIEVIKGEKLEEENLPLLKAVGRASVYKPRLVNLSYRGDPDSDEWIALVGKGICFDTGGLNIKVQNSMLDMHLDKHGACSVLSAIKSIASLKLKKNVTASFGFAQNSINSDAYRPSDIIKSRSGLTVEIGNTDAEGRLTLADVMTWTIEKYKPSTLIQLSTLTGAIITALGSSVAGLWTNDLELEGRLIEAGKVSRDRVWSLPILEEHRQLVRGKHADLTNFSGKNNGSSCQAAAFLENFVPHNVKWAHVDIAGASMAGGLGTGFGSRLLVKYIQSLTT